MMEGSRFLAGRRCAQTHLGDVCVLGLGVSGQAVVEYLLCEPADRVRSLTVFAGAADGASPEVQKLTQAGVRVVCGEQVEGSYDLCVASPGIPEVSGFYQSAQAACRELISEVELAWRESSPQTLWVGVTGTNGKTTTTALLAHVLNESGFDATACGNIGQACIGAVAAGGGPKARATGEASRDASGEAEASSSGAACHSAPRVLVAEVSSYQLASIHDFAPDVGIFLGITPDHLTWHGSFEAYANAKWRMLANIEKAGGVAVLDALNDVSREQVRRLRAQPPSASSSEQGSSERGFAYVPLGAKGGIRLDMRKVCGAQNAAFLDEADHLHVAYLGGEYVLAPASSLKIQGEHNVVNALAAASCAIALGAEGVDVTRALSTFFPLEHRIEPVGSVGDVEFYNDSKATNVDATLVALTSFPGRPLVVMLGGRDKLGPLDGLVAACKAHAVAVVVYGEAAERFEKAFCEGGSDSLEVMRAGSFDEAFQTAFEAAPAGGVVLLSPACASFDEFGSFEERGRHFKELVAALALSGR